jgi:hypothetical protein
MALESIARKQAEPTSLYRIAPHNIELEQALLGAILVNNEAFYRVSDFLEPRHFFEPIHQKLFEIAASLVRVFRSEYECRTFPVRRLRRLLREAGRRNDRERSDSRRLNNSS